MTVFNNPLLQVLNSLYGNFRSLDVGLPDVQMIYFVSLSPGLLGIGDKLADGRFGH